MEFEYKVVEHIATLSEGGGYSKQINLIAWNGRQPVIDIRKWKGDELQRGISLNRSEAVQREKALADYLEKTQRSEGGRP